MKPSVMKPAVLVKPGQRRRGAQHSAVVAVKPLNSPSALKEEPRNSDTHVRVHVFSVMQLTFNFCCDNPAHTNEGGGANVNLLCLVRLSHPPAWMLRGVTSPSWSLPPAQQERSFRPSPSSNRVQAQRAVCPSAVRPPESPARCPKGKQESELVCCWLGLEEAAPAECSLVSFPVWLWGKNKSTK